LLVLVLCAPLLCFAYLNNANTGPGYGYKSDMFKLSHPELCDRGLICLICGGVLKLPVQAEGGKCHHTFCASCFILWVRTCGICPMDGAVIDISNISMDHTKAEYVSRLKVTCAVCNKWHDVLDKLDAHVESAHVGKDVSALSIPLEIVQRGPRAVVSYQRALMSNKAVKMSIWRCCFMWNY